MPITRLFDETAVAELCTTDPDGRQTPEKFETIVIRKIEEFLAIYQEKVAGCIVAIQERHVGAVYRRTVEYDDFLEDAISDQAIELTRLGWGNVHGIAVPESWGEAELQRFARAHLQVRLSED